MTIPQRIIVIGVPTSGKSTLSKRLSFILGIPHIEIDQFRWDSQWNALPVDPVREALKQQLALNNAWVFDGNIDTPFGEEARQTADLIIWLDLSLPVLYWRFVKRAFQRTVLKQKGINENRESLRFLFLNKNSHLYHLARIQATHRKRYPIILAQLQQANPALHLVHLHTPKEASGWLTTFYANSQQR